MRNDDKFPRIAVLVDTSTGWGRRLIGGVMLYSQKHGPWHLWVEPHGLHEHLRPPPGWAGEGVIARVSTPTMAAQLRRMKIPVVNISGVRLAGPQFPRVTVDVKAAGALAARHFLDRGFRHFAYCGFLRFSYVAEHYEAFRDALRAAGGHDCAIYRPARAADSGGWKAQQTSLAHWLRQLPKPVAILSWARRGPAVLDACRSAGLAVPEEVAVLDGDEDDLLNELTTPPMSGIEVPSELIGHEAAAMLDGLMHARKPPAAPRLLQPTRVVARQSTEALAVDDSDIATALRYIRLHAGEPIGVEDVLREVPVSRRSLERNFHRLIGRSPAEEIRRVHLERARQLLVDTDLPIPKVADASGFGSPEYMSFAFKNAVGLTPLKYRSRMRAR